MTLATLLAAALFGPELPQPGYTLTITDGGRVVRLGLAAPALADAERELATQWKPSDDGSDPLDRVAPLLHVNVVPPSPHVQALSLALFDALDADHNGVVTVAEAAGAGAKLLAKFDVDGDDCLTPLEVVPDLLTAPALAPHPVTVSALPLPFAGDAQMYPLGASRCVRRLRDGMRFDLLTTPAIQRPAVPRTLERKGREAELTRFRRVADRVATLTVRPEPRGWFELADADGDGQLSVRELRAFWDNVTFGTHLNGAVPRRDLLASRPRTYTFDFAPGTATRPPVRLKKADPPASGPAWFSALDRNGDGDVSRREFPGTDAQFRLYDADRDGLISADEATAGDRRFLPKDKP